MLIFGLIIPCIIHEKQDSLLIHLTFPQADYVVPVDDEEDNYIEPTDESSPQPVKRKYSEYFIQRELTKRTCLARPTPGFTKLPMQELPYLWLYSIDQCSDTSTSEDRQKGTLLFTVQ